MKYKNIWVDIKYVIDYLPNKRCKKVRQQVIEEKVEFPISVVEDEREFPLVYIVKEHMSLYDGVKEYDNFTDNKRIGFKIVPEEVRHSLSKLYKPVRYSHGSAVSTAFKTIEDIPEEMSMRRETFYVEPVPEKYKASEESILIDTNFKEIFQKNLKESKKYIIYKGVLWEECGEPVYYINTFGIGQNHGGTSLFIGYYNKNEKYSNINRENSYRANEREQAIKDAKQIAENRGDTESISKIGNVDIEIVDSRFIG